MKSKEVKISLPSPKFAILYAKGFSYKVLWGGRGGAKSWAIVSALLYYATKANVKILCLREVQTAIKNSSYTLIKESIARMGIGYKFIFTESKILHKDTGAEFHFQGLSTTTNENIKSMEGYDIAWVEEAQCISKRSLEYLLPTVRKKGSECWFSFNPSLPSDPIYETFFVNNGLPKTISAKVSYLDNPYLSKKAVETAEHMKETDPKAYEHIYMGNFDSLSDEYFISLDAVNEAIHRAVAIDIRAKVIAGLDVSKGGKDSNALVLRQDNRVISLNTWKLKDTMDTIDKAVDIVLGAGGDTIIIDCQGLGDGVIDGARRLYPNINFMEFKSSFASTQPNHYFNARNEVWAKMKHWIENTGVIPQNHRLKTGLTTIKNVGRDRIQLADKKTQPFSPDEADALAMTFWDNGDEYMSDTDRDELYKMLYN